MPKAREKRSTPSKPSRGNPPSHGSLPNPRRGGRRATANAISSSGLGDAATVAPIGTGSSRSTSPLPSSRDRLSRPTPGTHANPTRTPSTRGNPRRRAQRARSSGLRAAAVETGPSRQRQRTLEERMVFSGEKKLLKETDEELSDEEYKEVIETPTGTGTEELRRSSRPRCKRDMVESPFNSQPSQSDSVC